MAISRNSPYQECPQFDGGPLVGCPIKGSVGLGGINRPTDVLTIQQFLNSLSPIEGGPDIYLKEDSISGPKTQAAIAKYQKKVIGYSDGRVDVDGATIRNLASYIIESPAVPPGRLGAPQLVAKSGGSPNTGRVNVGNAVARAAATAAIAEAIVNLQRYAPRLLAFQYKLARRTPQTIAFLNKHFSNNAETVKDPDIDHIQRILTAMLPYMTRSSAFGALMVESVLVYEADPPFKGGVFAYTSAGGNKLSTNETQIYFDEKKGINTKCPGSTIWVTDSFASDTADAVHRYWIALHELCHFVGAKEGQSGRVLDYAYIFNPRFRTLGKMQRLYNAETLSLCFLEYSVGTDVLLSNWGSQPIIEGSPRVSQTGEWVS